MDSSTSATEVVHDNVLLPPHTDEFSHLLAGIAMPDRSGPYVSREPVVMTQVIVEPEASVVIDPSLQAHLMRQGRHGLTKAEGRRKKAFTTRVPLDEFPVPYAWQTSDEWEADINSYLTGHTLRIMKRQGLTPSRTSLEEAQEELEDRLRYVAHKAAGPRLTEAPKAHRGRVLRREPNVLDPTEPTKVHEASGLIDAEQLDRMIESQVTYAWGVWRDDYYEKKSAAGKRGGEESKRPPKYVWIDIEGLEDLRYTDQVQAVMDVQGCKVRKAKALIAEWVKSVQDKQTAATEDEPKMSNEDEFNNAVHDKQTTPGPVSDRGAKAHLTDKPEVFDPYDPRCYLKEDGTTDWAMLFRAVP